ncbi:hypothetical protein GCM10009123_18830 [Kangiella japonica]|uniref:PAS domain S-box-containing protein/diguanylate cyclase (GGDEF) domain-containing protein n=1 Tax=Kangiella japonica TaxID=647384 RepID=A0ABN0T3Z0_9GAMM
MPTLELTSDLATAITNSLPIGICVATHDGEIVYANCKAEDIFGYRPGGMTNRCIEELIPEGYRNSHKKLREIYTASPTDTAMAGGRVLLGLKKDGVEIHLQIGLTPLNNKLILISLIETTNKIIKPSNSNDPLTGLANRKSFDEYSQKLRKLAIREKKSLSVAFIDLDNFKSVNDKYGHRFGDKVICKVARLLSKHIRESDILARFGGDEFVLCLYDIGDLNQLRKLLNNLIQQISAVNEIQGKSFRIGASIGAIITHKAENIELVEIIEITDRLMYQAKQSGKGVSVIHEIDNIKDVENI